LSSTGRFSLSKRAFYNRDDVAHQYDRQRFAGPSGARVNARELALVESLLPAAGRVLDLACGTGRLTRRLVARGHRVVAVDSSIAMLRETRRPGTTADRPGGAPGRPRLAGHRTPRRLPDLAVPLPPAAAARRAGARMARARAPAELALADGLAGDGRSGREGGDSACTSPRDIRLIR